LKILIFKQFFPSRKSAQDVSHRWSGSRSFVHFSTLVFAQNNFYFSVDFLRQLIESTVCTSNVLVSVELCRTHLNRKAVTNLATCRSLENS